MADVVFIHGMYMTAASWDAWRARWEARGHTTHAVSWPGRDGAPADLRARPPELLAALTLEEVIDQQRALVRSRPTPPVVVGHSMGGLIAQRLLEEGAASAAVALSPAPPQGVSTLSWSFLRANAPLLWPGNAPIEPTLASWTYAFAHTMADDDARAAYEAHVVPESRRVGRGPTGPAGRLDFSAPRGPLLLVAPELDQLLPAVLTRTTYERYRAGPTAVELLEAEGRTHGLCLQRGWEELSDAAAAWVEKLHAA